MTAALKKVSSVLVMWFFTVFAFVVLAVSVVLLTAQSLVSALFQSAKAQKKTSLKGHITEDRLASRES